MFLFLCFLVTSWDDRHDELGMAVAGQGERWLAGKSHVTTRDNKNQWEVRVLDSHLSLDQSQSPYLSIAAGETAAG